MKKILVVGNWKMHLNLQQASLLVHRLEQHIAAHRDVEVVLAPSTLTLHAVSLEIDRRKFRLAAQNASASDAGAQTGEVSFAMLHELVHYAIIGHSERRQQMGETLEQVRDKVQAAVRNRITPIICVGESSAERHSGHTKVVIHDQVTTALANLTGEEVSQAVIAYEPVWAIGSGEPATPAVIGEVISYIRTVVTSLYGKNAAAQLRILYGGSVVPDYVTGLLAIDGIDGFLVGGASLNYQQFADIVSKTHAAQLTPHHGRS